MVAIIPRLPERVVWNCPDDQEFPKPSNRDGSRSRNVLGLRCGWRPFSRPLAGAIRSLKTQQRAFTSRPLAQFAVQEEQDPSPTFGWGHFEHKLEAKLAG